MTQSESVPAYGEEIMRLVNLHEFEDAARKILPSYAYHYVAAGAADDLTLEANRAAYSQYWIRRRVMVDVSHVETSLELLAKPMPHPVLIAPAGMRDLMHADGEYLTAQAAANTGSILVGLQSDVAMRLARQNRSPRWWAATLGHRTEAEAVQWAKDSEGAGAEALCVSVDYPYSSARDWPSRDHWESEWSQTGRFNTGSGPLSFQAGMLAPFTSNMTWQYLDWLRHASGLALVVKGITTREDALQAVKAGAGAIIVSNHGGRTLDGGFGTLQVLKGIVDSVGKQVPVLVDGGIRRGGDVLKALALGARAVLIGRPCLWGLAAFGEPGCRRAIEIVVGELRTALGLSGTGTLSAIDPTLIRAAWAPYQPARRRGRARSGEPGKGA